MSGEGLQLFPSTFASSIFCSSAVHRFCLVQEKERISNPKPQNTEHANSKVSHPLDGSQMKFQLSGSASGAGPIRKGNFPSHRSLKRKRGVGEHPESSRLSCLPRLRPLGPPISLPPNPSLALQASMVFAFIGSLDLRPVVRPASGRGLASSSMRELALQSGFGQECLMYA